MPHIHALQGPPLPRSPRPPPPATSTLPAPLPLQDGALVETIAGPKISAIANTVKRMCGAEVAAPPAAE